MARPVWPLRPFRIVHTLEIDVAAVPARSNNSGVDLDRADKWPGGQSRRTVWLPGRPFPSWGTAVRSDRRLGATRLAVDPFHRVCHDHVGAIGAGGAQTHEVDLILRVPAWRSAGSAPQRAFDAIRAEPAPGQSVVASAAIRSATSGFTRFSGRRPCSTSRTFRAAVRHISRRVAPVARTPYPPCRDVGLTRESGVSTRRVPRLGLR
jgi:hypothetical protein